MASCRTGGTSASYTIPPMGHTVSDYIALARTLRDLLGYPVCLLNRERIFEQASEEWEKH